MDMALVAAISISVQANIVAQVQTSVAKEAMDSKNSVQSAKVLQTMPTVDANPSIGRNINVVA